MSDYSYNFDVALSFAGEDRKYVEEVAQVLRKMDIRVFYDKYETISFWGKDLYVHLREVYHKQAKYVVIFISKFYAEKLWTNHERESAQARAFSEKREYILPVKFDDVEISGILPTTGYIDLREVSPNKLALLIKEKIGPISRYEFFPNEPDSLFKIMKIKSKSKKQEVKFIAEVFFDHLKLMTALERQVLMTLVYYSCPCELPENVHVNIQYLSRLVSLSREEILNLFSRLDCLGIKSRVYEFHDFEQEDALINSKEFLEVKFEVHFKKYGGNYTNIMINISKVIHENLCIDCAKEAIERMDFSVLSTLTGFSEKTGSNPCTSS